jgi:predicted nucleic acid-binding protein
MKQLVVDSSVAIKWFIAEPYSGEARRILTEYQLQSSIDERFTACSTWL